MKTCPKCKSDKDFDCFGKSSSRKDGLRCYCKECESAYYKDRYTKYPEKYGNSSKTYLLTQKGKETRAAYQQTEKYKTTRAEYLSSDRAKELSRIRSERYKAKNEGVANARSKTWYEENKDRRREYDIKNANKIYARNSAYRKTPKGSLVSKIHGQNRRSRKRNAGGSYTHNDINNLLIMQKYKCPVCRTSIKEKYHIDHIVPLSKGGSNWKENIQLLCPTCNLTKQAKDPIDFMQERGFLL